MISNLGGAMFYTLIVLDGDLIKYWTHLSWTNDKYISKLKHTSLLWEEVIFGSFPSRYISESTLKTTTAAPNKWRGTYGKCQLVWASNADLGTQQRQKDKTG